MKGVVFAGNRGLAFQDFDDPTPGPDEVVLEIKASGMCGSDLKFYRAAPGQAARELGFKNPTPVIAGHEPCGVVVALGKNVKSGQAGTVPACWALMSISLVVKRATPPRSWT